MSAMHVPAPNHDRRPRWTEADLRALRDLVRAFPVATRVAFGSYGVVTWPRDWRAAMALVPEGLRAGDELKTVGYGAARGFPEMLLVRRVRDGVRHMVFPSDLDATAPDRWARQERQADDERWADDGGRPGHVGSLLEQGRRVLGRSDGASATRLTEQSCDARGD